MDEREKLRRIAEGLVEQLDGPGRAELAGMNLGVAEEGVGAVSWLDMKARLAPIEWDWRGWLPRGFVTILAAEPGMGKSLLCLRIASCYLSGRDWPDGRPFEGKGGKVVWCEGEGSQALNLARAEAMALNLADLISPLPNPFVSFRMDDERHMLRLLSHCRRAETGLVVMDSLSSLVLGGPRPSGLASESIRGIPRALHQLAEFARLTNVPILVTHHLRKRTAVDGKGAVQLDRVRGTSRIAQAARVVWTLDCPDVYDVEHRRLAVVKSNLMERPLALGMRIGAGALEFGEPPVVTGDVEMVSQVELAMDFLVDLLGEGLVGAAEVYEAGRAAGFSVRTLNRAKRRLGGRSVRGKEGWGWMIGKE